ncbi:6-carboxytetrahydropterin synthase QueD [Hydrogenovibrio halophilus]|uniref:6-carboxytetrahydropterin synthase QueD n=1 Tax=Hydrogenovibrio halophilus TaxID=373391 RepID=UPI00035D0999|nr:6-carboxytetrahydropterin synthase QueD [Hydrogenovibrio halophilus]
MAQTYFLNTLLEFASAHRLHGYPGDCANLHGHNWKVEVTVKGQQLNDIGMVMDFKAIKREAKAIIDELDHTYLNDHPAFKTANPTAENIARFLYQSLVERIESDQVRMHRITLWENDRNSVIYQETDD